MKTFTNPPDTLVIHCTASPNGQIETVEQIRAMHMAAPPKGRGFSDIGYHWVIGVDGVRYNGRPSNLTGAGVLGENSHTLHISMVGTDHFTFKQWECLSASVTEIMRQFPSIKKVCGHRDFSPDLNHDGKITPNEFIKLCPSFDVASWMKAGMEPLPNQTIS